MTAQIREALILHGEKVQLLCTPALPQDSRIEKGPFDPSPDDDKEPVIDSTACWRQYIGTWEIRSERLFLAGLRGQLRLKESQPILADWYSGGVGRGKLREYVHMGFGSQHEEEQLIRIRQGVVIKSITVRPGVDPHCPSNVRAAAS